MGKGDRTLALIRSGEARWALVWLLPVLAMLLAMSVVLEPASAQDLTFQHLAIVHATGHPAKYALNVLANLGRMFFG
jgi:hypothetical protein